MTYQTINPATGKLLKTYEDISDAALNEVMNVAQACYENDWRQRSVAQRAAIVSSVGPPTTIALGALALGEQFALPQWLGVALIIAGILVLELRWRRRSRAP